MSCSYEDLLLVRQRNLHVAGCQQDGICARWCRHLQVVRAYVRRTVRYPELVRTGSGGCIVLGVRGDGDVACARSGMTHRISAGVVALTGKRFRVAAYSRGLHRGVALDEADASIFHGPNGHESALQV